MEVSPGEARTLQTAIRSWRERGLLDEASSSRLLDDVKAERGGRVQLAQYFLLIATSCTLLAFGVLFLDEKILEQLRRYLDIPPIIVSAVCAALGVAWYVRLRKRHRASDEPIHPLYLVLGALPLLTAVVYAGKVFGHGPDYSGTLAGFGLALILSAAALRAPVLWGAGIAGLSASAIALTSAYATDYLFLGSAYPLRVVVLGALLAGCSALLPKQHFARRTTFLVGVVITAAGLWMLSVLGNYNSLTAWWDVRQTGMIGYALLFGGAGAAALMLGIRREDGFLRDAGLISLLVNFYTRYFEYFYESLNKGIFFLVLAVSFYGLARLLTAERGARWSFFRKVRRTTS